MDLAKLHHLVAAGESETVEFKKTTAELQGACESLCAFLNGTNPSTVVIGVSNGKLVGQEVSDHTQQEIANALNHIDPRIKINLVLIPIEKNRKAIVLEAQPQPDLAPFTFKGRPFWRTGTTTSIMPKEHYDKLLKDAIYKKDPYDRLLARDDSMGHLKVRTIEYVIAKGIELNRIPEEVKGGLEEMLEKLELTVQGKPTNALAILFGSKFFHYPQCRLHLARFKGIDKDEFLDMRLIRGNAFETFDEGMLFMQRHIPLWGKIESDSPFRKEDYLIPLDAFREAFVNAICHRDYADPTGSLSIAIYDDRMEIDNSGSLLHGLNVEDLKKSHKSQLRNPLIADAFYYCGLIEQWGRGTQKITKLCTHANLSEPEFISDHLGFKMIFRAQLKALGPRKLSEAKWSLRQREIYETIAKCQQISVQELETKFRRVTRRTLQRDLSALKQKKHVASIGKSQNTIWFVDPVGPPSS